MIRSSSRIMRRGLCGVLACSMRRQLSVVRGLLWGCCSGATHVYLEHRHERMMPVSHAAFLRGVGREDGKCRYHLPAPIIGLTPDNEPLTTDNGPECCMRVGVPKEIKPD